MKKILSYSLFLVCLLGTLSLSSTLAAYEEAKAPTPRPIEAIADILAWKSIRASVISNDGAWFAYMLAPQEGDGEVVIRRTEGEKELRFPIGEAPRMSGGAVAFSEDSQWLAYTVYPKRQEARKAAKTKKRLYNKAVLLNLKTEKEHAFEKVKSFRFSGENPAWIALHRNPPEGQAKEKDKWSGSDLLLFELATGKTLNFGNVSEFAFDKHGKWLAWLVDAQGCSGNGVLVRDMGTGVITPLDNAEAEYKRLTWTEKGEGFAVLKGVEHDDYEDKLFSVLGFSGFGPQGPQKAAYDPQEDESFPEKMTISPNRSPQWTEDLSGILFGIHEAKEKKDKKPGKEDEPAEKGKPAEVEKPEDSPEDEPKPKDKADPEIDKEDLPDLVIWHYRDKRMQSQQQVQSSRDKNFSYLAIYRVDKKVFIRLADDEVRDVTPAPKHRWAVGFDTREYELSSNLEGRRHQDVYVIDLRTGERRLALKKCRWYMGPAWDGEKLLFYQDGHYHVYEMAAGRTTNITKNVPTSFINTEDDHNVKDPPIYSFAWGWAKDSGSVLLYDNWDVWKVPAVKGGQAVNLTKNGKTDGIRYRSRFRLDPEEKGLDLEKPVYVSVYGEWTKKGGIGRIDKGRPGVKMLFWDDALYSLRKAKKADVYLYTRQTPKDYPDFYATDASLKPGTRITEANPQQKDFLWSDGARLVDYESAKGDRLQAALFLPANYEKGKSYPTVVYIYEKMSSRLNSYMAPAARGFNKTVYTSRGYAVLMPDIVYTINDPGMSSVWCVLPAIEAAVATGVVDKDRVGIHGHSWGGYQTAFLVTQTGLFKAAVAGAPLTNMISMYSSIYWNSGSANQPIFESSQGRFKGNYLDNLEAYERNSPVYYAHNVRTPLIILHNDKDGAVDWNQGIEYFNTLRQLRKPVLMLQYKGENHGLRKPANLKDYHVRMQEFFDHYLRSMPAPGWLTDGISHLDHEQHIKDRTKQIIGEKKEAKKPEAKKK
jgi:dipeptidyl aminopeptidase/acylaminoacyl peptidase